MRPKRIVFVWFPNLPMDRWWRTSNGDDGRFDRDVPIVLTRDGPRGPVVHAVSHAASLRGMRTGTRVVDAQSVHPELVVEPADPGGDTAMLDRLVLWARRWCPWTVRDGSNGISMDATGSAHLLGGEARFLADVVQRFADQGLTARVAMAPTRLAARALALHGPERIVNAVRDPVRHLAPLPVTALGLDRDIVQLLDRFGAKTIGALAAMPRTVLARRFAEVPAETNPVIALERAMGRRADPISAPPDEKRWIVRSRLAEPVMDAEPFLPDLVRRLCEELARTGSGARALRLAVYRVDGDRRVLSAATARPTRDPDHLRRLLAGRLDRIDPGFGFDLITLEATRAERWDPRQGELDGASDPNVDMAALVDRLTARFGPESVSWSAWTESHVPERVENHVPALSSGPRTMPILDMERPIRLLDRAEAIETIYDVPDGPPARFVWRRVALLIVRSSGPERIAPEWWRARPGSRLRDYYKVEVEDGRRFWIYREGVFGNGRGGAPRWFLHGFFA